MSDGRYVDERPVVMVEWVDSRQPSSNWMFVDDLADPTAVHVATVGWLLNSCGDETLCIAASLGDLKEERRQVCGVMQIPLRCVTRFTILQAALQSGNKE